MSVDILYLAWNRREYTEFSFEKLIENTNWNDVDRLIVYDDNSTDGTAHWLSEQVVELNREAIVHTEMHNTRFNSPVATMNHYLDHYDSDRFAKIDSDIVVPPWWLQEMNRMMYLYPSLDILGMQADSGPPAMGHCSERHTEEARWIGGVGLFRRRAFGLCRPTPNGRFGLTEWQQHRPDQTKAWIKPDLPTFELDKVPLEPWRSLAAKYVDLGWARPWGPYHPGATAYWSWALQ